jgi:hypothetical protein
MILLQSQTNISIFNLCLILYIFIFIIVQLNKKLTTSKKKLGCQLISFVIHMNNEGGNLNFSLHPPFFFLSSSLVFFILFLTFILVNYFSLLFMKLS